MMAASVKQTSGWWSVAVFWIIALGAWGTAGYALFAYTLVPLGNLVHPEMKTAFEAHRVGILLHIFGSAFTLLLGPTQFMPRLRAARPGVHRLLGRLYLGVGVGVGGLSGLYAAFFAFGGWVSTVGFAALSLAWLYTGWRGYRAAVGRRFDEHRRWMVHNFALAFAAVTLRAQLGVGFAVGLPFESFYPVLAWSCWVPNLLVTKWWLARQPR